MNTTEINLHGILAEQIGKSQWNLAIDSVGDAIRGIQANTKKLYQQLVENDKSNIKYRVLINKKDFLFDETKDPNSEEGLRSSELMMKSKKLKTIDIVPVLEGADEDGKSIISIIIGIALIATGIFAPVGMFAAPLIMAGIGLVVAGIANLLTPEPEFDDFREIEGGECRGTGRLNILSLTREISYTKEQQSLIGVKTDKPWEKNKNKQDRQ